MVPGAVAPAWPLPADHVRRPRLVDRILTAGRPVALVAGGGYGKTTVAAEAAQAHRGPVVPVRVPSAGTGRAALLRLLARRAQQTGLSDLALLLRLEADPEEVVDDLHSALPGGGPPVLVLLDEVQHLDDEAADWLCSLLDPTPVGLHVVLIGRSLPPRLDRAPGRGLLELVGPDDLGFDAGEVAAAAAARGLPSSEATVSSIHERSGGWPALVCLLLRRPEPSATGRTDDPGRALAGLVEHHLADLSQADRTALAQAARLPLLHPAVDVALGAPDLGRRAGDAGLPLTIDLDDRWRLADPVAEHLRTLAPLDAEVARTVARTYRQLGEGVLAARLLVAVGDAGAAADVVAGWESTLDDDADDVAALLDALPTSASARRPRALLIGSRAHHRLGHHLRRAELLDLARAATAADGDVEGAALRREVEAEWSWMASGGDEPEAAVDLATRVLEQAPEHEVGTRSRALAGLGMALARRSGGASAAGAGRALEAAIRLFEDRGEREVAAEALLHLGYHQYYDGGRAADGAAALRRALSLVPGRTRLRSRLSMCLAEVLAGSGDHPGARARLDEAAYLASTVGNLEITAYVAWLRMELASREGDRAGVLAGIATAENSRGEWWARTGGGAFFLSDATVAAARVDTALAAEQLARLREHPAVVPVLVDVASAALDVRTGRPEEALRSLQRAADDLPPRLRWWAALMRAAAHHAAGRTQEVRRELGGMTAEAAAIGQPDLPAAVEGPLLASLEGRERRAAPVLVTAMGGFAVRRDGRELNLPPGHVTRLVQALAAGGPLRVEAALDLLWPDADLEAGRRRLRNVLLRLRTACPGLVERDGERLVLGPDVRVDVDDFDDAASRALGPEPDPGAARTAVARYGGDLLADLPEEDWVASRRERLRLRLLDLLDLLVDAAIEDDDVDEALRLTDRAIQVDPLDDRRHLTAVALLVDRGRHTAARSMLSRAEAMRADLGLPPSRAHLALRERLTAL